MSGHSKWASIRHKKAAVDAKRSNAFTKVANTITFAARRGGGDPNFNPSLRTALDAARKVNMPKDKMEKAIKRGTGELGGAAVEELLYEGFGPGNTAILVEVVTDNRNRSGADVRNIFNKTGGRFADGGGIAYQFTQKGVVRIDLGTKTEDEVVEAALEAGAEDYRVGEGHAIVYTAVPDIHTSKDVFEQAGFSVDSAQIEFVANTPIDLDDNDLEKVAGLVEALEDYEDVTNVYTNLSE